MKITSVLNLVEQKMINDARTQATVVGVDSESGEKITLGITINKQLYDDPKEGGGWEGTVKSVLGTEEVRKRLRGSKVDVFLDADNKGVSVKGKDGWHLKIEKGKAKDVKRPVNEGEEGYGKFDEYKRGTTFTLNGDKGTIEVEHVREKKDGDDKHISVWIIKDNDEIFGKDSTEVGHLALLKVKPGGEDWTLTRDSYKLSN